MTCRGYRCACTQLRPVRKSGEWTICACHHTTQTHSKGTP
jgi:hypothetical protein